MPACALSPHPPSGRKMRVYQREEALGGPEAHVVFLEPSQAAEQGLSTEEPRPAGLPGPARGGLGGPERRRFSASELVTRLHSSLRLGRSSAARAWSPGSGSGPGAAREGTSSPRGPKKSSRGRCGEGRGRCTPEARVVPSTALGASLSSAPLQGKCLGETRAV